MGIEVEVGNIRDRVLEFPGNEALLGWQLVFKSPVVASFNIDSSHLISLHLTFFHSSSLRFTSSTAVLFLNRLRHFHIRI